jgi:uncharacterized membrane protein YdbT with pleckstrin-like domain
MNENKYLEENNATCETVTALEQKEESIVSDESNSTPELALIEMIEEDVEISTTGKKKQPAMGMAITSMILAIVSLMFIGELISAVISLTLASTAKKRGNTSGFATAGRVIGIVSVVIHFVIHVIFIIFVVLLSIVSRAIITGWFNMG